MSHGPIIIGGFGRSGTTWLSDIISKILGGLILFEPFHPAVFEQAGKYCYQSSPDNLDALITQWDACASASISNPWLIRNHIKDPLEDCSEDFIRYIWKHSRVLGFKTIRCNHLLSYIQEKLEAQVVYIHRHPLAVLTSIMNRPNFWKEFGWDWHINKFLDRSLHEDNFSIYELKHLASIIVALKYDEERVLFMWSISLMLTLRQLKESAGHIISYEHLYLDPYPEVSSLLDFLHLDGAGIHPSHLFTPSMTTLNTLHHHVGPKSLTRSDLDNLFWKNQLDPIQIGSLTALVSRVLEIDKEAYSLAVTSKYLGIR